MSLGGLILHTCFIKCLPLCYFLLFCSLWSLKEVGSIGHVILLTKGSIFIDNGEMMIYQNSFSKEGLSCKQQHFPLCTLHGQGKMAFRTSFGLRAETLLQTNTIQYSTTTFIVMWSAAIETSQHCCIYDTDIFTVIILTLKWTTTSSQSK